MHKTEGNYIRAQNLWDRVFNNGGTEQLHTWDLQMPAETRVRGCGESMPLSLHKLRLQAVGALLSLTQPGNTRSRLARGPNSSSAAVWSWANHCVSLRLVFLLKMSLDVAPW